MNKQLIFRNQAINYLLKISRRARRLRLTVYLDGRVVLTCPRLMPVKIAERFMLTKASWLLDKLTRFKNNPLPPVKPHSRADYLKRKEVARIFVNDRLAHFNKFYNFTYRNVSIRDQKTRWGSCSKVKNLNFSYRLLDLAPEVADYIIVHELCHLREFNHSPRFWDLVAKTMPDYVARRRRLKKPIV